MTNKGTLIAVATATLVAVGTALFLTQAGGDGPSRMTSLEELQARGGTPIDLETHPGQALFEQNCLSCHNGTVTKAPAVVWLEMLEPDMILSSMREGIMQQQAAHLSEDEQLHIAEYLARIELDDYVPPAPPPANSIPWL